jgi:DNA-binding HxlR family transcriptional regulator
MSPRRTCIAGPPHKVVSMDKRRRFLSVLGAARTMDILEYLHEHGAVQHREFNAFMNVCTLNTRLRQLLRFRIIEHHFEKKPKKKEWYTITAKGEKILQYLKELTELIED